ncbi:hypothetical protein T484DRAFT_1623663, partial [Baffinella frigidus]
GLGFRVQDSEFRVQGLGFRVQGLRFRVSCFVFRVSGFGFWGLGCGVTPPIPSKWTTPLEGFSPSRRHSYPFAQCAKLMPPPAARGTLFKCRLYTAPF